jgi:phosphopantothenoylcysteine synthetase/decarboxylase
MWQHPLTQEQLEKLQSLKYNQIPPISKTLACGDCGKVWQNQIVQNYIPTKQQSCINQ